MEDPHGISKRRTWRKLHLAVDEQTGDILAAEVSLNDKQNSHLLEPLLDAIEDDIEQVRADGAYDTRDCYQVITKRHAVVASPARKDAKTWQHGNCKQEPHPSDQNLRLIRRHGRAKFKRLVNYHRRSIAESTRVRFKSTFLAKAFSRLKLKCKALNKMIQLTKPESYLVT